jgi:hypothetical protein
MDIDEEDNGEMLDLIRVQNAHRTYMAENKGTTLIDAARFLPLYGYDAKGERAMGLDCTIAATDPDLPKDREIRRSAPAKVISFSRTSYVPNDEIYSFKCSDGCTREYNATKHRVWRERGYRSKYYDDNDMTTTADKMNTFIGFTFFFYSLDGEDPDKTFFTTSHY